MTDREAKSRQRKINKACRHARRDQRKAERKQRRRELLCWWTFPFGHHTRPIDDFEGTYCVDCGQARSTNGQIAVMVPQAADPDAILRGE